MQWGFKFVASIAVVHGRFKFVTNTAAAIGILSNFVLHCAEIVPLSLLKNPKQKHYQNFWLPLAFLPFICFSSFSYLLPEQLWCYEKCPHKGYCTCRNMFLDAIKEQFLPIAGIVVLRVIVIIGTWILGFFQRDRTEMQVLTQKLFK